MNRKSIDRATNADLRGSWQAIQRAALRARQVAAQTNTELVIGREGQVELIKPTSPLENLQVQESSVSYPKLD